MNKIAIVVQRYGKEVNGGAELHARLLAERLNDIYEVEILTSCTLDYHKWDNHYPEGEDEVNGIRVLRFKNTNTNTKPNIRLSRYISGNNKYYNTRYSFSNFIPLTYRRLKYRRKGYHDQRFYLWIAGHGPICKGMITYIDQEKEKYKAIIFFTYLFYPTYFGLQKAANKSILIPTAHDEPILYYPCFKEIFSLPKFIMYNTENEINLVRSTYPESQYIKSDIAGVGFDELLFDKDIKSKVDSRYFVYIGRIDKSKGCEELIDYFSNLNIEGLNLVMIGKNHLKKEIKRDNIFLPGFISESDKLQYLQHCEALIIPSRYESLSMVTLEAMSAGKPVLANGHCDVLKTHIEKSKAGFVYFDASDFTFNIKKFCHCRNRIKKI